MMQQDPMPRWAAPSVALMAVVYAAVLFGSAGRLNIIAFWCWIAVMLSVSVVALLVVDPDLVRERMRPGGKRLPWRYWLLTLMFVAHLALAGLDRGRLHWSDTVPMWLRVVALLAFAASWVPFVWAMHVNRFFSSIPRIQTERRHQVITSGPYSFVRHPGYAGAFIAVLASGIALGSWLAAALAWLGIPLLLWRTVAEDRLLHAELPGYAEYAKRVPARLLPGVW